MMYFPVPRNVIDCIYYATMSFYYNHYDYYEYSTYIGNLIMEDLKWTKRVIENNYISE